MVEDPLTVVLVCGGLGLIALGAIAIVVERLTRPNPGYARRHHARSLPTVVHESPSLAAWDPSGSWRMPGVASHRAEDAPDASTRPLHPGYRAAGRATVFRRHHPGTQPTEAQWRERGRAQREDSQGDHEGP
jgi:hypothetical protein